MIGFLEGLVVTLKTTLRRPVTAQYPDPNKRIQVAARFMGFPALTWDAEVAEPYCTGCMVCIRDCPTQCMSAQMKDNPLFSEGKSRRRKIIEEFEINLGRCILCGICVDVCNFDAIEMGHEHELSKYERNGNRVDLPQLLEMGKEYQAEVGWKPEQPEKNSGVPLKQDSAPDDEAVRTSATAAPAKEISQEERLAAARARAQAKQGATSEAAGEAPAKDITNEERLAAARARAQAKRGAGETAAGEATSPTTPPTTTPTMTPTVTKEERLEAARARARAKREDAKQADAPQESGAPVDAESG
ncbi:MAG: NADH-quinone oxidoreductase subunit I [Chloroflexi bacterium]|nr:NADH-quinone oxidoreductase subunit I [Chloroflexota bacterium]